MDEVQRQDPPVKQLSGNSHHIIKACKPINLQRSMFEESKLQERPLRIADDSGWQVLHYAAELPNTFCHAALREMEESLAGSLTRQNMTALIAAADSADVNAVKVLLPLLDAQDVCLQDAYGLNALYYAVKANNSNGNKIALMLLEINSDISQHECSTKIDSLPYRVVMNRNSVLLKEMLKLGLDPHHGLQGTSMMLAGVCVQQDWSEGLGLVIAAEKKRCTILQGFCGTEDICRLLFPINKESLDWNCPSINHLTAWNLVFKIGSVACFEVMMKEGMPLKYIVDEARYSTRLGKDQADPYCYCSPLTLLLGADMWKKRALLKKFLQIESCQDVNHHHRELVNYAISSQLSKVNPPLFAHPLIAAARAILGSKPKHSVDESIQMLLDNGFTFDFDIAFYQNGKLDWMSSISMLLWLTNHGGHVPGIHEIVYSLLDHSINLPVTTDAVPLAFKTSFKYPALNPMSIMRHIARRPTLDIQQAYERMVVTGHNITTTRQFKDERPDQVWHTEIHHWFVLAQLLLKGVRADTSRGEASSRLSFFYHRHTRIIPFSVLMLSDANRDVFFRRCFVANKNDEYESSLVAQRISSLQCLCRKVIRDQIGFSRLIREPVPRGTICSYGPVHTCSPYVAVPVCVCGYPFCEHASNLVHIPDEIVVEESWELSSIELLPIPNSAKNFLRLKPDLREYCQYLRASRMTRCPHHQDDESFSEPDDESFSELDYEPFSEPDDIY